MSEEDLNDPVFLREQLARAVAALRARDETTAQIVERLEGQYASQYEEIRKTRERSRQRFEELQADLRQAAMRYSALRQHQVRVRALGIMAKGKALDAALDAALAQMGVEPLEQLTIEAGVSRAIHGRQH